eukprot:scaffold626482_cov20-Prasinocladus_malaysianus.AAC.1
MTKKDTINTEDHAITPQAHTASKYRKLVSQTLASDRVGQLAHIACTGLPLLLCSFQCLDHTARIY